ncbi:ATP-binding protein [Halorientalis halophila]|uniref:ATP-binding protein n=1 Tax=Halorientalis halophila TaxID=3108499 RepID=UPI00300BACEB
MDSGEGNGPFDAEHVEDSLDRMTDAFMALDEDWQFTYLNERAKRVVSEAMSVEQSDAKLEGRVIWNAIPELTGTRFEEHYREAMRTQSQVSFEAQYDPLEAWFEITAYPSASGLSVYFRDVTERKRQREQLETQETVLREIYEVISNQDLAFDGRVQELLAIGCRELGTDYGSLSRVRDEKYVFEVVRSPDDAIEVGDVVDLEVTHCERVVLDEERLVAGDVAGEHPELTEKAGYAEWGISCYLGTPVLVDGDVYGTFCFYDTTARDGTFSEWDVTLVDLMGRWVGSALERELTEERLRRQNDRLEQFATIVSHDLRNPLGVALQRVELLSRDCESDHLPVIQRAHERMETLIDDVLTMTRAGDTVQDTEEVRMTAVATDAWETVQTGAASLEVAPDLAVSCDRSRLQQLLENLFRNAIEHGGPEVTVRISSLRGGFAVADDGPGIPVAERDDVFEFGYSTTEGGSGVGLATVEQIAAAHGWEVELGEDSDAGAKFEFLTTSDR